jgi:hypothetical protein
MEFLFGTHSSEYCFGLSPNSLFIPSFGSETFHCHKFTLLWRKNKIYTMENQKGKLVFLFEERGKMRDERGKMKDER